MNSYFNSTLAVQYMWVKVLTCERLCNNCVSQSMWTINLVSRPTYHPLFDCFKCSHIRLWLLRVYIVYAYRYAYCQYVQRRYQFLHRNGNCNRNCEESGANLDHHCEVTPNIVTHTVVNLRELRSPLDLLDTKWKDLWMLLDKSLVQTKLMCNLECC